ncbi:MAG: YdhR family protein [Anaerolineaceae bacterium]|nr:YdhR family protein [Anaerolineaceae bacterium]MCB9099074.1 YdhR family protein [Anaerolineales bacterium]
MSKTILQINFKFDMSKEEYLEIARAVAEPIAQFRGCLWKVWLLNEEEQEAGGIYLFENVKAVQDYLDSPIVAKMASHPRLNRLSLKTFASIDELTEITRGPVGNI